MLFRHSLSVGHCRCSQLTPTLGQHFNTKTPEPSLPPANGRVTRSQPPRGEALIFGLAPNGSDADDIGMAYIVSRHNRFYVVAYDGVDPATGRERRRWHAAGPSRADAEAIASSITETNRVPTRVDETRSLSVTT